MKNKLLLALAFIFLPFTLVSCGHTATVAEAINKIGLSTEPIDNSRKYDLDSRFECFQLFYANATGVLHLNEETGLVSLYFDTSENEDGSVLCTLTGIYLIDVGNVGMGQIDEDRLTEFLGNDLTFTLVLENNIVTSHDLPELLDIYK